MVEYKAVYKCRLCGGVVRTRRSVNEEKATQYLGDLVAGVRGAGAPNLTIMHHCGGYYEGSLGLADFQGYERQEEGQT